MGAFKQLYVLKMNNCWIRGISSAAIPYAIILSSVSLVIKYVADFKQRVLGYSFSTVIHTKMVTYVSEVKGCIFQVFLSLLYTIAVK